MVHHVIIILATLLVLEDLVPGRDPHEHLLRFLLLLGLDELVRMPFKSELPVCPGDLNFVRVSGKSVLI